MRNRAPRAGFAGSRGRSFHSLRGAGRNRAPRVLRGSAEEIGTRRATPGRSRSRRGSPSAGARAVRSGRPKRRAEFVAPGARVAPADDVVVRPAVRRDDLPVADEKYHGERTVVDAARVLAVDPHADPPAVAEGAQRRFLLEELLGSGLELDDRAA